MARPRREAGRLNVAICPRVTTRARADYGTVRSESLGHQSADYTTNHVATFPNNGAAALLTRHVQRRTGALRDGPGNRSTSGNLSRSPTP